MGHETPLSWHILSQVFSLPIYCIHLSSKGTQISYNQQMIVDGIVRYEQFNRLNK